MFLSKVYCLVCLLIFNFLLVQSVESQVVSVADFGLGPDSFENATPFVQNAINEAQKSGAKMLIFPKGRYDFWPDGAIRAKYFISNTSTEKEDSAKIRTIGMLFKKAKDLTIDGNGSLFIFHGKMTTIVLDNCENVRLQNIGVDFERPSMSEMQLLGMGDRKVQMNIHPDSKYVILNNKLTWYGEGWKTSHFHAVEYDTTLKTMRYSNWKIFANSKATEIRPNVVQFEMQENLSVKSGNMLTVRDIIRDQVGMLILESKNVTLQDVGMHYMHGLGIVSQFTENVTMRRVICAPRPESNRIIASSADFMHFSGCRGQVIIEDCRFSGAHDDPINVHGTNLRIMEKTGENKLKLRFMHGQSYGFNAFFSGDEVAFVHSSSMERFAKGTVKSVERISDRELLVTFQNAIPTDLEPNDCVENMTWTPEVLIRGCHFTRTNTRGILLTTPRKALIEHNVFLRTGMSAILIEADAEGWYESGPVRDVTIRNNQFIDCAYQGGPGNATIAIHPSNKKADVKKPVHFNIKIENNSFKVFDYPVLYAKSTKGLLFRNNVIARTNLLIPQSENKNMFYFNGCSDVEIHGTRIGGDLLGLNVKTENMIPGNIRIGSKEGLKMEMK